MYQTFFYVVLFQLLLSKYMELFHILYISKTIYILHKKKKFYDKYFNILGYISSGSIFLLSSDLDYTGCLKKEATH